MNTELNDDAISRLILSTAVSIFTAFSHRGASRLSMADATKFAALMVGYSFNAEIQGVARNVDQYASKIEQLRIATVRRIVDEIRQQDAEDHEAELGREDSHVDKFKRSKLS